MQRLINKSTIYFINRLPDTFIKQTKIKQILGYILVSYILTWLEDIGPNSRRFIIFKSTDYLNLLTTISAK